MAGQKSRNMERAMVLAEEYRALMERGDHDRLPGIRETIECLLGTTELPSEIRVAMGAESRTYRGTGFHNCSTEPVGPEGSCLHGTPRCGAHLGRSGPMWDSLKTVAAKIDAARVGPHVENLLFEDLQRCLNLAKNTRDAERWTALQWLKLYAAYKACAWDVTPDEWSPEQVEAALEHGSVPAFKEKRGSAVPVPVDHAQAEERMHGRKVEP